MQRRIARPKLGLVDRRVGIDIRLKALAVLIHDLGRLRRIDVAVPFVAVDADIEAGDHAIAGGNVRQIDRDRSGAALRDLHAAKRDLMASIRVKSNCAGIGVEAERRAGDLVVQRNGIVDAGLLLTEGLRARLAVLQHGDRAVFQPLQRRLARSGDQNAVRCGVPLEIDRSLDAVAVVEAERRHDGVALLKLGHFIGGNGEGIRSLPCKHLAREILAALVVARLGLGGAAGRDADTAPILAVIVPVVAGDLDGHGRGGRGEGLFHDLEAVFLRGVADEIFPRGSPAAVIGHGERQLFARSQAAQARKRHKLAHHRRFQLRKRRLDASAEERGGFQHAGLGVVALHLREHRKRGAAVGQLALDIHGERRVCLCDRDALGHIVGGRRDGGVAHDRIQELPGGGRGAERQRVFTGMQPDGGKIAGIQRAAVIEIENVGRDLLARVQRNDLEDAAGRHAREADLHSRGGAVHLAHDGDDGRLLFIRDRDRLRGIIDRLAAAAVAEDGKQPASGLRRGGQLQRVFTGVQISDDGKIQARVAVESGRVIRLLRAQLDHTENAACGEVFQHDRKLCRAVGDVRRADRHGRHGIAVCDLDGIAVGVGPVVTRVAPVIQIRLHVFACGQLGRVDGEGVCIRACVFEAAQRRPGRIAHAPVGLGAVRADAQAERGV